MIKNEETLIPYVKYKVIGVFLLNRIILKLHEDKSSNLINKTISPKGKNYRATTADTTVGRFVP